MSSVQRVVTTQALRHALRRPSRHPVNRVQFDEASLGERVADSVARFIGSWRFLILQTIVVLVWIAGNVVLLFHFDPYPFIALNLAFSTQAAYAAPLILLASNRAADRDRMTLEHAAGQADLEEHQNEQIIAMLNDLSKRLEGLERMRQPGH